MSFYKYVNGKVIGYTLNSIVVKSRTREMTLELENFCRCPAVIFANVQVTSEAASFLQKLVVKMFCKTCVIKLNTEGKVVDIGLKKLNKGISQYRWRK